MESSDGEVNSDCDVAPASLGNPAKPRKTCVRVKRLSKEVCSDDGSVCSTSNMPAVGGVCHEDVRRPCRKNKKVSTVCSGLTGDPKVPVAKIDVAALAAAEPEPNISADAWTRAEFFGTGVLTATMGLSFIIYFFQGVVASQGPVQKQV